MLNATNVSPAASLVVAPAAAASAGSSHSSLPSSSSLASLPLCSILCSARSYRVIQSSVCRFRGLI
ncbi:hypothetical protein NC652_011928 [Populus alba x Populus x berolinensis]|nr:hypothetical protein NC652_011928 [Populus alba x Populus x berolinensis]KAJ7001775.1 hypothetical protein NC653_012005 [Populus alba x Populus x berolinensis]